MRERDLLIAQTLAFVESVTGKKPDADKPLALTAPAFDPPAASPPMPDIEAMLAETVATHEPSEPLQVARAPQRSEYRNEIQARVANFRAHQQRFLREREEYCASTMAKVQKVLSDMPPPRPDK
ncbi:hypothetical protein [Bradyrhizobium lablabi]|uniref:hypothetical protein n=1 Tax=Bradyrhizobium lablabi TaxID=722472 RepID=UPI0032DE683D